MITLHDIRVYSPPSRLVTLIVTQRSDDEYRVEYQESRDGRPAGQAECTYDSQQTVGYWLQRELDRIICSPEAKFLLITSPEEIKWYRFPIPFRPVRLEWPYLPSPNDIMHVFGNTNGIVFACRKSITVISRS